MTRLTDRGSTAADDYRMPPSVAADGAVSAATDVGANEAARAGLEAKPAVRDPLPARAMMPWLATVLGVAALAGVAVAGLGALFAVVTIEHWLIPNGDAADASHGVALGVANLAWGLLSLGLLAGAARVILGRAATLGRGDVATGGVVLLLQAGWTTGLHAWIVGVAGYVELQLVQPGTYAWPLIVMLVTVALTAVRLSPGRIAAVLLGFAALAIGALLVETLQNGLGAIADGDVSAPGVAVGILSAAQMVVLGVWWWRTVRSSPDRRSMREDRP